MENHNSLILNTIKGFSITLLCNIGSIFWSNLLLILYFLLPVRSRFCDCSLFFIPECIFASTSHLVFKVKQMI